MKFKALVIATLFLFTVPVALEAQTPKVEFGGGYSFLRTETTNANAHGWYGNVVGNFTDWFGVEVQGTGNYADRSVYKYTVSTAVHTLQAGPRFAFRGDDSLTPFAHVLVGVDNRTPGRANQVTSLGGGVTAWDGNTGVSIGVDYRRVNMDRIQNGFAINVGFSLRR